MMNGSQLDFCRAFIGVIERNKSSDNDNDDDDDALSLKKYRKECLTIS